MMQVVQAHGPMAMPVVGTVCGPMPMVCQAPVAFVVNMQGALPGSVVNVPGGHPMAFAPNAVPIMVQPVQPVQQTPPVQRLQFQDVHSEPSSLSPTPSEKSFRRETTGSTIASALSTSSFGLSESDRSMSPIESPTEGGQGFSVQGRVWQLCQQQTGCRRVQAALDECGSDQERKALAEELLGHVWEAARCPFGNYVLQRFITLLRPSDCQFIIKEISSHGGRAPTQLARHRYGCRILQRLLEQCRPEQMEPVTNSLLKEALQLVRHQYGNFVMQRILSHGTPAQQHLLCQVLEPHARDLTTDQNASAVLAKAMVHCRSEDKASLARRLLSQPGLLLASSKTRHGHQTALALIRALEGDELLEAVNMMKCNMASLMQCRYGRVVLRGIPALGECALPREEDTDS